jgi:hypothetical protein
LRPIDYRRGGPSCHDKKKTSYKAREAVTTARMSQEEAHPEKKEAVVVDLSNDDE